MKLMTGIELLAVGAVLMSVLLNAAAPAEAQTLACGRHEIVLNHLRQQYEERVAVQALQEDGRLLELTASIDGATWTALVTSADGVTCVVAAGRHLVRFPPLSGQDRPDGHGL